MDELKEKIESIVEKIKESSALKEQFEKEPVKVIEKVLGVDLPDELVEKLIDGVKAKLAAEKLSGLAGKLKKLF